MYKNQTVIDCQCPYCLKQIDKLPATKEECGYCGEIYTRRQVIELNGEPTNNSYIYAWADSPDEIQEILGRKQ